MTTFNHFWRAVQEVISQRSAIATSQHQYNQHNSATHQMFNIRSFTGYLLQQSVACKINKCYEYLRVVWFLQNMGVHMNSYLLLVVALTMPSKAHSLSHSLQSQSPIQRAHDALLGMFEYFYRRVSCMHLWNWFSCIIFMSPSNAPLFFCCFYRTETPVQPNPECFCFGCDKNACLPPECVYCGIYADSCNGPKADGCFTNYTNACTCRGVSVCVCVCVCVRARQHFFPLMTCR